MDTHLPFILDFLLHQGFHVITLYPFRKKDTTTLLLPGHQSLETYAEKALLFPTIVLTLQLVSKTLEELEVKILQQVNKDFFFWFFSFSAFPALRVSE